MSNSLVLCEGKTDAVIIGYLLMGCYGWELAKKDNSKPPNAIAVSKEESFQWFRKDGNYAAVCGVGGKSSLVKFLNEKVKNYQNDQSSDKTFSKILVFRDHDEDEISDIEMELSANGLGLSFKSGRWTTATLHDGFRQEYALRTCLSIVPKDEEGDLEKVILDSIAEREDDKPIVEASTSFVDEAKGKAVKYLPKKRLVEKAKVGVVFALMSPEKVFSFMDEILNGIDWAKYNTAVNVFSELKNIEDPF